MVIFKYKPLYVLDWYYTDKARGLGNYNYSQLLLKREGQADFNVVPLKMKKGGMLAFVPAGAFTDAELQAGNENRGAWWGAKAKIEVNMAYHPGELADEEEDEQEKINGVIIDFTGMKYRSFVHWMPDERYHSWGIGVGREPTWTELMEQAATFIQDQVEAGSDQVRAYSDYDTAAEAAEAELSEVGTPRPGAAETVAAPAGPTAASIFTAGLRSAAAAALGVGDGANGGPSAGALGRAGAREPPPRPETRGRTALEMVQGLAGPAPGLRTTAAAKATARAGRGPPVLPMEEDGGVEAALGAALAGAGATGGSLDPSVVQLLTLQLLARLQEKPKSAPDPLGLPEDISSQFKPAQQVVHAAALRDTVRLNPKAAYEKVEKGLMEAICVKELDEKSALVYAKQKMLVGKCEWAGHVVCMLAAIHGAMVEGDLDRARFLSVGSLLVMDTYLLENSWGLGYRILNIDEPPWSTWDPQQVKKLALMQARSKLMPAAWWQVFNAEAKEEDQAIKRRAGYTPPTKGSGRGQDGATGGGAAH